MKNKLIKKIVAVLLSSVMIAGCLSACGQKETGKTGEESKVTSETKKETPAASESKVTEESKEEVKEIVELTYWCDLDSSTATSLTSLNDMEMLKVAQEKTYVDITYSHPATGTAKEQFNLKMSGLDLEDIMEYGWGSYPGGPTQAIADGVIIDLAPYIEQGLAPNLKKILDENPEIARQLITDKGEIPYFPCFGIGALDVSGGYILREDMLKAVGLDMPVTIADWEEMLTAFKDQLGVESPWSGIDKNLVGNNAYLAGAFDTFPDFYLRDGKVQYGFLDDSFKDYLTLLKKWYDAELIDQDIFGNDGKITNSKILNDQAAMFYGFIGSGIGTLMSSAKEVNPDMNLIGIPFPVQKEGDVPRFYAKTWEVRTSGMAAITTACEDVEAAIAYLDFWYTEEGRLLRNFGVEGVSYTMVDGVPTYTDEVMKNPDGLSISQAISKYTRAAIPTVGLIDRGYYAQYYELKEQVDAMNLWNEDTSPANEVLLPTLNISSEHSDELASIKASVSTFVTEEATKFILGLRDLSEWNDFVAQLKELNIERALEIQQEAYDAYMAK